MEAKQSRFVESCDSDIKKLFANADPESSKKSTKYALTSLKKVSSRLSDLILRKLELAFLGAVLARFENYSEDYEINENPVLDC